MKMFIAQAVNVLLGGGVVACPTEGVYGLSCMPDDPDALVKLLILKRRNPDKGLILIAANPSQLEPWIGSAAGDIPTPNDAQPTTWIAPAVTGVSPLLRGNHSSLAVRITTHAIARALCDAADSPLVSTSANIAGRPIARNPYVLRRQFMGLVDYIVPGYCGVATGPSEIRELLSGRVLRQRLS